MTDKEIINALNTATNIEGLHIYCIDYDNKPKVKTMLSIKSDIVDLINRQQAEHDELKNNYRETLTKQVELCDVIEKQQAEIERLKPLEENLDKLLYMLNVVDMGQSVLEEQKRTIKAEAIKEFAGKIADVFCSHDKGDAYVREVVYNLVKELEGEDK